MRHRPNLLRSGPAALPTPSHCPSSSCACVVHPDIRVGAEAWRRRGTSCGGDLPRSAALGGRGRFACRASTGVSLLRARLVLPPVLRRTPVVPRLRCPHMAPVCPCRHPCRLPVRRATQPRANPTAGTALVARKLCFPSRLALPSNPPSPSTETWRCHTHPQAAHRTKRQTRHDDTGKKQEYKEALKKNKHTRVEIHGSRGGPNRRAHTHAAAASVRARAQG